MFKDFLLPFCYSFYFDSIVAGELIIISTFINLLRLSLWPRILSVLVYVQWPFEKNVFMCSCWAKCSINAD